MSESVRGVFAFRERTRKIQIYPLYYAVGNVFRQIFRHTFDEKYVFYSRCLCFFTRLNDYVAVFFNGYDVIFGVKQSKFTRKLTFAASDFKDQRIVIAENRGEIKILFFLRSDVEVQLV